MKLKKDMTACRSEVFRRVLEKTLELGRETMVRLVFDNTYSTHGSLVGQVEGMFILKVGIEKVDKEAVRRMEENLARELSLGASLMPQQHQLPQQTPIMTIEGFEVFDVENLVQLWVESASAPSYLTAKVQTFKCDHTGCPNAATTDVIATDGTPYRFCDEHAGIDPCVLGKLHAASVEDLLRTRGAHYEDLDDDEEPETDATPGIKRTSETIQ